MALACCGIVFYWPVNGADRPNWACKSVLLTRVAFDDLLGVALGIAMIVLVLEGAARATKNSCQASPLTR